MNRSHRRRQSLRAASVGVGLSFLTILVGCSSKPPAQSSSTTPHDVTLTTAQRQRIHVDLVEAESYAPKVTTTGVVDFDRNRAVSVLAPFSGLVTQVLVTAGQHVAKGQVLARVESPDFSIAVGAYRKALISAKAADAIAENDRALYVHQAISERENAQAQADAVGADADRDAALEALSALHVTSKEIAAIRSGKTVMEGKGAIRSPIDGTVVEKSIARGQILAAGTSPCFDIADTSKMWVLAQLFGSDVARVHADDTATVNVGMEHAPMDGIVTNVGLAVDPTTSSVDARVRVDNPEGILRKRMYVAVDIQSRKRFKGLLIPVSAVLRDDENLPFVYVMETDGSYARRSVTLGMRVGNRNVISKGLYPGDKVVVDGSIFLRFIQTQ